MRPSRPNGVLNQGKPAYGYGPVGSELTSICRSETARSNQALSCPLTDLAGTAKLATGHARRRLHRAPVRGRNGGASGWRHSR